MCALLTTAGCTRVDDLGPAETAAGGGEDGAAGAGASDATPAVSEGTDSASPGPQQLCEPGLQQCHYNDVVLCNADGTEFESVEACALGQVCFSGECMGCFPGTSSCADGTLSRCGDDGVWYPEQDCRATHQDCVLGACVSPCFEDFKSNTYSGCDYWAVDLDNVAQAQNGPFALLVANLADTPTEVKVTRRDSAAVTTEIALSVTVQPGALEVLPLEQRHLDGAGIGWNAWRLETTSPVVAYQFNPLSNVDVFSNDASLLLPVHSHGKEYLVVSAPQLTGAGPGGQGVTEYRGTATIVANTPETTVTITPSVRTLAGDGLPSMAAGETQSFVLWPYQILNLKSDSPGGDLTGTEILANHPVAVFTGHESAPSSDKCCTDHLEQQLYPVARWGTRYVATKAIPRNVEPDYWRVLASQADTKVTFTPAVAAPVVLQRGESFELATSADFLVEADKPVLLTQLLASSGEVVSPPPGSPCIDTSECHPGYTCEVTDALYTGCTAPTCGGPGAACLPGHTCRCQGADEAGDGEAGVGGEPAVPDCRCVPIGDPSLILAAPEGQFRANYIFLTPSAYAFDYVNLIVPLGATVALDGIAIGPSALTAIPGTGYSVARLAVSDGIHEVIATAPMSVVVYGYDDDVSYGYLGGLGLHDLGH